MQTVIIFTKKQNQLTAKTAKILRKDRKELKDIVLTLSALRSSPP
jgi:hypothetical protein